MWCDHRVFEEEKSSREVNTKDVMRQYKYVRPEEDGCPSVVGGKKGGMMEGAPLCSLRDLNSSITPVALPPQEYGNGAAGED